MSNNDNQEFEAMATQALLRTAQAAIDELKALDGSAGALSDGYHTYDDLYNQRMVLTAALVKSYPDRAWKSLQHDDGTMFDGYFIVGLSTPGGSYTYHYPTDDWDLFDAPEISHAPLYDGHTSKDVDRLLTLVPDRPVSPQERAFNRILEAYAFSGKGALPKYLADEVAQVLQDYRKERVAEWNDNRR